MSNYADDEGYADWLNERPDPEPPEAVHPDDHIGTITLTSEPPF